MLHKVFALFRSTHPLPSLSVASFAVLLGVSAGLPLERLGLVGLAVLAQQFSVGLSNDWLDAERDLAVKRTDKPVALGIVSVPVVRTASLLSAALALALALGLGGATFLWMVPMLAIGWAYNLGLKSNALSVVPYIIGFGMLPAFVTFSGKEPSLPPVWVMLVAALFGVSAHFANALPDLLEDRQTGIKALPHLLGQRLSALLIALSAGLASLILVTESERLNPNIATIGFGLTLLLTVVAWFLALRPKPPKLVFHLLLVATLVNLVMLMLGA